MVRQIHTFPATDNSRIKKTMVTGAGTIIIKMFDDSGILQDNRKNNVLILIIKLVSVYFFLNKT